MTYNEFINNILETRGRFACGEEYHERHHIVPRCMGGSNEENNFIDLYAREHFIAHKLLAIEHSDNQKLVYAFWMMAHCKSNKQDRYECTPEEYEEAKIAFSIAWSENHSGENAPMYGKHLSEEARKKISDAKKGNRHTQEARDKMSENHADVFGENNPWYGKHPSEETREKMRNAWTDERRAKNSAIHKGKTLSNETIEKLRAQHIGVKLTNETRKKMSESHKKPIICIELNILFLSAKDAGEELNIDSSAISKCCRGVKNFNTVGGYHWRFASEEEILIYKNNLEI